MFLDIGFRNTVNIDNIDIIANAGTSPMTRAKQTAQSENKYIDVSMGRKTKALIFTKTHVIGSCIEPKTLYERLEKLKNSKN